ncbi:SIR2 family protein [Morganella morganii]|uniref:SIR2 family protein n=1 Tax=Morganella morganii TaxID=582 RepID=A0AAE4FEF4_MORMO|nr:SIR2 family protein [Morganella morganii]EJD6038259.1 SIR2 family protein [Morganella morganii]MBC3968560.1 SIR2 family protein [Morganella morganii]MDS0898446.1 SIR2 family protein [Morganella morganii]HBN5713615.1 SIR2 family protein [Morganella morganii]
MTETIFNFKNYPIVFVGSGISKRYLKNFPKWDGLLEEYWAKITDNSNNFYNYLNRLKKEYQENYADETDLNHKIYTEAASYIEEKFNDLFNEGAITLDGLTAKIVFSERISPFKYSLCQKFSSLELRDDIDEDEFKSFKKFLKKAKMIVTTNYDPFIESLLREQSVTPKIYVGNDGFFDDTVGWSELYKIHGDVNDPHSIIITKQDYDFYDEKSILISAKILSNMIKNPIMFMGYSLSDRNVRKLLSDFSSQLPSEDDRVSAERIILIEYKKDEQVVLKKHVTDQQLKISYTSIETDNYKAIYDDILLVDEGLSPYEVLRYQRAIKNLIINEGEKGNLDTLLVTPADLDQLEEAVKQGKNLVVALGDKKYVSTYIDENHYINDYILEKNEISNKTAIKYLLDVNSTTRVPFSRLIKSCNFNRIELKSKEIKKLNNRIARHGKLDSIIDAINLDKVNSQKKFSSIAEINAEQFNKFKELTVIVKNIKNIEQNELVHYVKNIAIPLFNDVNTDDNIKTELRKLFLCFDLLFNGDVSQIMQNKK